MSEALELLRGVDLTKLAKADKLALLELLQTRERLIRENALARYQPYPKQAEFHAAGGFAGVRERLLVAGNQVGKTWSAGFEVAMHLTGLYPDWWVGKRWKRPVFGWASGVTGESTRDNPQRILLGRVGDWGTGAIPAAAIQPLDKSIVRSAHGVADAVDHVKVKHVSGGISLLYFKHYSQGREKWQGESLDLVWFDEEPPEDIYTEGLTRTNATRGVTFITFTPLLGMSNVVKRFLLDKQPGTHVTQMTIEDALHYSPEQRAAIIASYPAHEREARTMGIPIMGSGRVFPVEEGAFSEGRIDIPHWWPRIAAIDFGWDHPTAAVWLAWDRDTDTIHLYDCYRVRQESVLIHSEAIKSRGAWIPVAWPHDGRNETAQAQGVSLSQQYRKRGVNMLKDAATWPDGSNGVEAGLMDMLDRMQTGRLRVASHLNDWWEEFRIYHRDDGKLVKKGDDLMCLHPDTEVITSAGKVPIRDLVGTTGTVLSTGGQMTAYSNCRRTRVDAELVKVVFDDGYELLCTPDHLLLSAAGEWVPAAASEHVYCHNAVPSSVGATWTKSSSTASGLPGSASIGVPRAGSFTERFGNTIAARFRRAITSTTRTVTARTTASTTSSSSAVDSISAITTRATRAGQMRPSRLFLPGEPLRRASVTCRKWVGATRFIYRRLVSSCASAAAHFSSPFALATTDSVLTPARPRADADPVSTRLTPSALSAPQPFVRTDSGRRSVARAAAAADSGSPHLLAGSISRVSRVEGAGRSDVFCMEVPGLHAFAVGNGVVVHNCATRYAIMMLRKAEIMPTTRVDTAVTGYGVLDLETGF